MSAAAPELLAIVGPTASGKTHEGLDYARSHQGEIISVDSRQIYRGLSVGTATPKGSWTGGTYQVDGIPYHLVDIVSPEQIFSAADFAAAATEKIEQILRRNHVPILVGGTGFYFRALLEGLADLPSANATIRARLKKQTETHGRPWLHEQLKRVDPLAAEKIPANNWHRVIRALEVFEVTGKPMSQWQEEHQKEIKARAPRWKVRWLGIDPGKEALDQRIADRSAAMLQGGMIEETQTALTMGISKTSPGLSGLGYPGVIDFLENRISKEDLLIRLIRETKQYAKRQRTWFRHQVKVEWKKS